MGLDMYLERFPRYKNYGPDAMRAVSSYIEWLNNERAKVYTFEEWTGIKEGVLPQGEDLDYLMSLSKTQYYAWDDEKRWPHEGITEHVGYWRKANAVHHWFVVNVQDGVDDCEYHHEVTKADLTRLRDNCAKILEEAVLINGKVRNGYRWTERGEEPIWEDGKRVLNPEICEYLLPTEDGFFFGNIEYNEWYLDGIRETFEICDRVLKETDFEAQMIYYVSSW